MPVSALDIFRLGIGPSSSHTVGPMRAAHRFARGLLQSKPAVIAGLRVELYGSLGHTGKGHGTDRAVVLGLLGELPESVDTERVPEIMAQVREHGQLTLLRQRMVPIDLGRDLIFHKRQSLPAHPNGMRFVAFGGGGETLHERQYFSVGGGFVVDGEELATDQAVAHRTLLPYPFTNGDKLLALCESTGLCVSTLMLRNEAAWRPEAMVRARLLGLAAAMRDCIARGCEREGVLPGGLKVRRRAPALYRRLKGSADSPLKALDWLNLFALAVNEENAAPGRVVTAPTNGAAGIIPAVLEHYRREHPQADDDGVVRFLLAAGAIAIIFKEGASISGAEVGCQGEVGVACSMAAAGLTEALGGTPSQVENAAEIAMEHNLGLTCDPVGGLVQVPCIERNAMGAVKALNAARLALSGDGRHHVSLDKVVRTMRQTGADMKTKYKETARGGLAVNVIEC